MTAGEEAERQRAELQRDMGRLEGKVDSILTNISNLMAAMIRSDADRDNLARDMAEVERKATESINKMRTEFQARHDEFQITYGDIKSKLYWLGGAAAAGGMGVGAGAKALFAALLGFHG
jgi:predicted  nucleic acid-binding Zn-ribbon protein